MDISEKIGLLLEEKYAADEAFADCFTVAVELKPGQKLHVFADCDSGLTLEKCQKLSRYLESHLDANQWLGESYTLEVSSPGIDRPLLFPRQYAKNLGRTLAVWLKDKTQQTATLLSADETHIVLTETVVEKDGKKKIKKEVQTPIPYDQIEKAVVSLGF